MKGKDGLRDQEFFVSLEAVLHHEVRVALRRLSLETGQFRGGNEGYDSIPFTSRLQGFAINYRSAIAVSLGRNNGKLAQQLAQSLVKDLKQEINPDFAEIRWVFPAWVEFTLTENAIQQWLQGCLESLVKIPLDFSSRITILYFPNYVRDRCFQLLRLGAEEHLISPPEVTLEEWQGWRFSQLNTLQSPDWQLIYQLIATTDRLQKTSSQKQLEKLATALGKTFLDFHRQCQLFDRQQSHFPHLSTLRLYLIAITQKLLQDLGY